MWDQEDAAAVDKLEMAENGLNFSLSVFGSFLYFLGAFFFLPPYSYMQDGIWIFIAGSAVIMTPNAFMTDEASVGVPVQRGVWGMIAALRDSAATLVFEITVVNHSLSV